MTHQWSLSEQMEKFVPQGIVKSSSELDKVGGKKSYIGAYKYPYRKPTQVGRKKIFRRTREILLRNSAN